MSKKHVKLQFKSEKEESAFWQKNDSTDYVDWSLAKKVKFSNLKPSTKTISLRLPISMLEDIKVIANKNDVPYQSLIKVFLQEKIRERKV